MLLAARDDEISDACIPTQCYALGLRWISGKELGIDEMTAWRQRRQQNPAATCVHVADRSLIFESIPVSF